MDEIRRTAARRAQLARAPGGRVTLFDPKPLVKVRAVYGRAVAETATHVMHEWVKAGQPHIRWDEKWQVQPVTTEEWDGESLGLQGAVE